MHQDKDRGAKWLIDHHGDAILKLAGIEGIASWKAVQAELVAPRRFPDGVLEVTLAGDKEPTLFLIEVETYADQRAAKQVFEDVLLTRIECGIVPNAILVVLQPRGNVRVAAHSDELSSGTLTTLSASWPVVEMWDHDADDLLARNEVGLIPWVPLTRMTGPPEQVLRQCRAVIDRLADPAEHEPLLVATAILSTLVFKGTMLGIFGVSENMLEIPYFDQIVEKRELRLMRKTIVTVLRTRFGTVPARLNTKLDAIEDPERLDQILQFASICPDPESLANEAERS